MLPEKHLRALPVILFVSPSQQERISGSRIRYGGPCVLPLPAPISWELNSTSELQAVSNSWQIKAASRGFEKSTGIHPANSEDYLFVKRPVFWGKEHNGTSALSPTILPSSSPQSNQLLLFSYHKVQFIYLFDCEEKQILYHVISTFWNLSWLCLREERTHLKL